MFIKICGVTSPGAVEAAVEAGADAVGFVFAPSSRRVTTLRARECCVGMPKRVIRIAVMHHPDADLVAQVLEEFAPDWLQTDAEDFAAFDLPAGCGALPVFRTGRTPEHGRLPPRLLFEGPVSGSGETADWREARALAAGTHLVLAGGLNPDNVEDAIRAVKPWGIDVSSGVERAPGEKDALKIEQFVARARSAAAGIEAREQTAGGRDEQVDGGMT